VTFTTTYVPGNLDQLDSSFVYYLMYDMSRTVRANDIDHIMPKSLLENLNYDWAKINSIKNFQLLDYGTNRGEKNGKAFAIWVGNPAYVVDQVAYLKLHLIPTDTGLWSEDRFEEFCVARGQLILAKLVQHAT